MNANNPRTIFGLAILVFLRFNFGSRIMCHRCGSRKLALLAATASAAHPTTYVVKHKPAVVVECIDFSLRILGLRSVLLPMSCTQETQVLKGVGSWTYRAATWDVLWVGLCSLQKWLHFLTCIITRVIVCPDNAVNDLGVIIELTHHFGFLSFHPGWLHSSQNLGFFAFRHSTESHSCKKPNQMLVSKSRPPALTSV